MSNASQNLRSTGQTFMTGPNLYFRAPDLNDAKTAAIWRDSPFPAPVEIVQEEMQKRFDKGMAAEERNQLLIACRKSDDQPVGSVDMAMHGWKLVELSWVVDRLASPEQQDRLLAEMVQLIVPWSIKERHAMSVAFSIPAGTSIVEQTAIRLGGKRASRIRERYLLDGCRVDEHFFQFLNPAWLEKLGIPIFEDEEPVERIVSSPAKPPIRVDENHRPETATMIGERLYLRPLAPSDAERAEYLSRRETEVVFPEGRWIINAPAFNRTAVMAAEEALPNRIYFAIALRESDEFIGIVGLVRVDWVHRAAETVSEIYLPAFRGNGYGTEAKHLLLEYAFEVIGLHMLYSYVADVNPRSAAALRKQGYRLAGSIAWESFVEEGISGAWTFDLLAAEWRAARHAGRKG